MREDQEKIQQFIAQLKRDVPLLPNVSESIEKHAAYCFKAIYSNHYFGALYEKVSDSGIAYSLPRPIHGIAHVSRVAFYILAFQQFYQRYISDVSISPEDLHLLQIAALFHDAGREDDGKDFWDKDSAEMLYHYLIKLGVCTQKAVELSEVIANKDQVLASPSSIYRLEVSDDNVLKWKKDKAWGPRAQKNLLARLLHDADCLDIIRARPQFTISYLDCYRDIESNREAIYLLGELIIEARRLICDQGDTFLALDPVKKNIFSTQNCFFDTRLLIVSSEFPVLHALINRELRDISYPRTFDSNKNDPAYFSDENMMAAMREGRLFARGIPTLSRYYNKTDMDSDEEDFLQTHAEVEIAKSMRRLGVPVKTRRAGTERMKDGNVARSAVCLIGRGTALFSGVSFGILNPAEEKLMCIDPVDSDTGRKGKKHFPSTFSGPIEQHKDRIRMQRDQFIRAAVEGKLPIYQKNDPILYSEAVFYRLYDTDFHCILYSANNLLEAIYLQGVFENKTGRVLPIFEYNGNRNTISRKNTSEKNILKLWKNAVSHFTARLNIINLMRLFSFSEDENALLSFLRIAVFSEQSHFVSPKYLHHYQALDAFYRVELRKAIEDLFLEKKFEIYDRLFSELNNYLEFEEEFSNLVSLVLENSKCLETLALIETSFATVALVADYRSRFHDHFSKYISTIKLNHFNVAEELIILFRLVHAIGDSQLISSTQEKAKSLIYLAANIVNEKMGNADVCLSDMLNILHSFPQDVQLSVDPDVVRLQQLQKTKFSEYLLGPAPQDFSFLNFMYPYLSHPEEKIVFLEKAIDLLGQSVIELNGDKMWQFCNFSQPAYQDFALLTDLKKLKDILLTMAMNHPVQSVVLLFLPSCALFEYLAKDFQFVIALLNNLYRDRRLDYTWIDLADDSGRVFPNHSSVRFWPVQKISAMISSHSHYSDDQLRILSDFFADLWQHYFEDNKKRNTFSDFQCVVSDGDSDVENDVSVDFREEENILFLMSEIMSCLELEEAYGKNHPISTCIPPYIFDHFIEQFKIITNWENLDKVFYSTLYKFLDVAPLNIQQSRSVHSLLNEKAPTRGGILKKLEANLLVGKGQNTAYNCGLFASSSFSGPPPVASRKPNVLI